MTKIAPLTVIATATKAQHLDAAKAALQKVYDNAPESGSVDAHFWTEVAKLHTAIAQATP